MVVWGEMVMEGFGKVYRVLLCFWDKMYFFFHSASVSSLHEGNLFHGLVENNFHICEVPDQDFILLHHMMFLLFAKPKGRKSFDWKIYFYFIDIYQIWHCLGTNPSLKLQTGISESCSLICLFSKVLTFVFPFLFLLLSIGFIWGRK